MQIRKDPIGNIDALSQLKYTDLGYLIWFIDIGVFIIINGLQLVSTMGPFCPTGLEHGCDTRPTGLEHRHVLAD
jgi:hypothetical protein